MGKRSVVVGVVLGVVGVLVPLAGAARAGTMTVSTAVMGQYGSDVNAYDGAAYGPDFAGGEWHILRTPATMYCSSTYTGWWDLSDATGNRLAGTLTEPCAGSPTEVNVTMLTVTGGEGRYAGVSGSGTLTGRFHHEGDLDGSTTMAGLVQLTVEDTGTPPPPPRAKAFTGQAVLHDPDQTQRHYTGQVTSTEGTFELTIDLSAIDPRPPGCEYLEHQEGTFVLDDGQGNRLSGSAQAGGYGHHGYEILGSGCENAILPPSEGSKSFGFTGESGTGRFANPNLIGDLGASGSSPAELTGTLYMREEH